MNRNRGFTLLELIFVIAIMSTMAIFGLAAYQQKVMNRKIDTATIEMQAWLQASLRFYSDNNRWPNSTSELIPNYMSNSDLPNPWNPDPNASMYNYNVAPDGSKIKVWTYIPPAYKNANQIAIMIAGRLPFGHPTGNPEIDKVNPPTTLPKVWIEMPAPATLIQHQQSIFMGTQTITCTSATGGPPTCDTSSIQRFNCPANYHPNVSVALSGFTTYGYDTNNMAWLGKVYTSNMYNVPKQAWDTSVSVISGPPNKPIYGSGQFVAISTCDVNTPTNTNNASTNNNNNNPQYIF